MVQRFRIRTDLERVSIDGFALPLGIAPRPGRLQAPHQGYTVNFVAGQDDEPDTYSFHIVVSHERLAGILHRAFELLPDEIFAIVEIGSRDAYRSTDTYISDEPVQLEEFLRSWHEYEPFLLEESCIAAGANSEEPFVEIFLDQWKGLALHVPPEMRDDVEQMLRDLGLEEVPQTWSDRPEELSLLEDADGSNLTQDFGADQEEAGGIRPVLDLSDPNAPDVDELLLDLRRVWKLALNIDPESNVDEGGRNLGSTLWHAIVIMDTVAGDGAGAAAGPGNGSPSEQDAPGSSAGAPVGGYASVWATASSINQMEQLMQDALDKYPQWRFGEIYTIDRVAFDERPDELADLRPNRREPKVHLVSVEPWGELEKRVGDKK